MNAPVLVATGTKREAATLTRAGLKVMAGGGDPDGLRDKLRAVASDARGVLSFGFAGALNDAFGIGDWVVGDRLTGRAAAVCDRDWSAALVTQLPGARGGTVYADGRLISSTADKLALGARHGAVAVDMESHIAAQVAAERGLPFAIVRCISDEARHVLPPAIAVAMRADGGVDGLAMIRSLVVQPSQLSELMRTMIGFARAMRALKRGAVLIDPDARQTVAD